MTLKPETFSDDEFRIDPSLDIDPWDYDDPLYDDEWEDKHAMADFD